jgi:hypothetical protein
MRSMGNAYKIIVGKPEGIKQLGRPECNWDDNIRTSLRETGCERVDWIHLAQDRDQWRALVNMVMKFSFL